MLQVTKDGDRICVRQTIFSANFTDHQYWYYDMAAKLKSSHGREGDPCDRPMTNDDMQWAVKYYIPLLK